MESGKMLPSSPPVQRLYEKTALLSQGSPPREPTMLGVRRDNQGWGVGKKSREREQKKGDRGQQGGERRQDSAPSYQIRALPQRDG